ncbi:hypothetical protein J4419_01030 [Candidatus Woesearchaeota archaeon]|nr:hypothetical protein [Candidatus Woesearchaeota archaeon]
MVFEHARKSLAYPTLKRYGLRFGDFRHVNFSDESFSDMEFRKIAPGFSQSLQKEILGAGKKVKVAIRKGVYVQIKGPRLQTSAETKVLKGWGNIVGMALGTGHARKGDRIALCLCLWGRAGKKPRQNGEAGPAFAQGMNRHL